MAKKKKATRKKKHPIITKVRRGINEHKRAIKLMNNLPHPEQVSSETQSLIASVKRLEGTEKSIQHYLDQNIK